MRTFITRYNGARPFRVEIDDEARVLRAFRSTDRDNGLMFGVQPVYELAFEQVYIAHNIGPDGFTILATTHGGRRMHAIIYDIREFDLLPGDVFVAFHTKMGPNEVPYSWIEGTRRFYSITEHVSIPREWRDAVQLGASYDMHDQIYGAYAHRASVLGLSAELANRNIWDYVREHLAFATDVIIGNGTSSNR